MLTHGAHTLYIFLFIDNVDFIPAIICLTVDFFYYLQNTWRRVCQATCNACVLLTEREFDPDIHCGVIDLDTKKPCTRSLTCKVGRLLKVKPTILINVGDQDVPHCSQSLSDPERMLCGLF